MNKTKPKIHPFPGLRPFEEEEEHLFFGREKSVTELLSRLRTARFLGVIGTSGSGKSSLIKAGLLPSLYRGFMAHAGSSWRVALFRPGDNPIGNLADVLAKIGLLSKDADDTKKAADGNAIHGKFIETTLRRSNRGLIELVKQARLPEYENLLIVVDQFEELFRFSKLEKDKQDGKRDSAAFIKLLLETSGQAEFPIYVLLTMRSDFLGDCTEFHGLPEAINKSQYLIPRMTREEKRAAIAGPIAVGGAEISPTLLSRLLNDVGDSPDQLPILQHALMRTWDYWAENHREGEPLDLKHYEAIGTMEHALSQHAEEAFAELKTTKSQLICEKMFKRLTDRGDTGRGVRRPAKVSEICRVANASEKEVISVVNVFRRPGRTFLMPPPEVSLNADSVIDISHESLMRIWARLIEWVNQEAQSAELYLRLAKAAGLFDEGKVGLWRDPELMLALKWREEIKPNAVWAERYDPSYDQAIGFLESSKEQKEREVKEKEKQQKAKIIRNRIFSITISIISIIAVSFALWALKSKREALEQQKIAEDAQKIAEYERKIAVKKRDEAVKEKEKAAKSEKEAKEAKKKAEKSANAERLAKIEAEKNQEKAEREERKAKENEMKEQIQGVIVDMNKEEANFRQYLAKANELAVHSISIAHTEGKELKVLLALTAFRINSNAYIDLSHGTQAIFNDFDENTLDEVGGNKELVEVYEKLGKAYKNLQEKSRIRRQPEEIFGALRNAYIAEMGSEEDILYKDAESWALAAVDNSIVFNNREGELLLASLKLKSNDSTLPVINKKETISLSKSTLLQAGSLAVTDDRLFCGTLDGSLIYWEKSKWKKGEEKKEKRLPVNHGAKILSMAFSKNRNSLVYSVQNMIYIQNMKEMPQEVVTFEKDNFIRALTVIEDPNGKHSFLIAADSKGNIFLYDLSSDLNPKEKKRLNASINSTGFHAIAYNSVGKLLALANSRGEIFLFPNIDCKSLTSNGKKHYYKEDKKHKGIVRALAFSRDGRYLAAGGLDGTITLWDLKGEQTVDIASQAPILTITGKRKILSIVFVFDPTGEYMIFNDENHLRICPTSPETFYKMLCKRKKREFTKNEWNHYIGESVKKEDIIICPSGKRERERK
jgi:WD40 repeat protein/energy-coupling factor transporter ATP-binding protein EcfA2